jgi:hypothetical protein
VSRPPFLASPLLAEIPGVRHAFFTRRGGVSQGIYESLNAGYGSGDEAANVAENRRRAAAVFGVDEEALKTTYQTHSNIALMADGTWMGERPVGDAVVTRNAGVVCAVLTADCAPVLIADPHARVVAALHAGWRGALRGIVASAVSAMGGLGARPSRMVAAIGPCIAQASYQVGLDFLASFEAQGIDAERFFIADADPSKRRFDLPAFVATRLAEAGVMKCEWIGRDTVAGEAEFFSNRRAHLREDADYGRLLSAIALDEGA